MPYNRATLYSNGIADFQRVFSVAGGKKTLISLAVRQEHLADVLASLTVSGDVSVDRPPSFQPANQDDSSILVATDDSIISLAHQLAGAKIEIVIAQQTVSGTLMGVQDQEAGSGGEPVTEQYLVVMTDAGVSQYSIRKIESLRFTEESIRSEISKGMNRRMREIKPNSTVVELELSSTTKKKTDAIIQYTIPAAAWKITYRIIVREDSSIELQGHAVVDNNTDEDWNDFIIVVVMGQPITFSTDLADSKTPGRNHVDIVQESAIGSVEIEKPMSMPVPDDADSAVFGMVKESRPVRMTMKASAVGGRRGRSAAVDEMEVTETGDFCVFESAQPVSIDARRSAIIPVFQELIGESKSVLHFKFDNHPERPFQAIEFTNSTSHSLGRGVCTVYNQATYVGSCIVPAVEPGGTALLTHALETAVRVRRIPNKIQSRRIGIQISDGVACESYHKLLRTEYVINSNRSVSHPFILDHDVKLDQGKVICQIFREGIEPLEVDSVTLKNGRRIEFELLANDVVKVVFVETCVSKSRVQLTGTGPLDEQFQIQWLYDNLIEANSALVKEPAVSKCIELQKLLDEKKARIKHANDELGRLNNRQERLRKNIASGVGDQQKAKWQDDLATAEDNIVQLEEDYLPGLLDERESFRRELYVALNELVVEWSE